MSIYNEVISLPNFGYLFEDESGALHIAILGGHSCEATEAYEFVESICRLHSQMEQLYSKDLLSVDDKTQLAKYMKRMQSFCEKRKIGLHSLAEQREYIDNLTLEEKIQIEKQIGMYNDCRCFYRDFIHRS